MTRPLPRPLPRNRKSPLMAGEKEQSGGEDRPPKDEAGAKKKLDKDEELFGKMTFIEHLEELRYRLIVTVLTFACCFIVIYASSIETIKYYFTLPLLDVLEKLDSSLIYTGMAEGFLFELKLSAVAALFVSSSMIFYQFWAFVAPGLYKKEKYYAGPFIISSTFFFSAGAAFFYFIVFPIAADFFSTFAAEGQIEWKPRLSEVFSFVMMLMIAFGLVFELPVVTFILARLRIISAAFLNKNRKYAILIMVTMAAFFTPPDLISQALLAGPMWVLYELSVLVTWIFGPRPKGDEDEDS